MRDFIRTELRSFLKLFRSERYKWIGSESPDLKWWEAHIDFLYDTELEKTVGYRRTSSWNCDVDYGVLGSLATPDMLTWYENYQEEQRLKRIEYNKEQKKEAKKREAYYKKHPEKRPKPFDPNKPGLLEFLEDDTVIGYSPSTLDMDAIMTAITNLWFNDDKK